MGHARRVDRLRGVGSHDGKLSGWFSIQISNSVQLCFERLRLLGFWMVGALGPELLLIRQTCQLLHYATETRIANYNR